MIQMKNRIIAVFLSCAALALLVWGQQNSAGKEETIELGIFVGSNWDVANTNTYVIVDAVVQKFEEEHPGVTVHYNSGIRKSDYSEWLAQKSLKGEMPDVFMVLPDDFEKLVSMGLLKELDKLIDSDADIQPGQYYEAALDTGKLNQIQYTLPYEVVPNLMFVNKTLLEEEGYHVPEADWTWDDLYEISKGVTQDKDGDGQLEWFGTYNYDWEDAVYTNGAQIFADGGTESNMADKRVVESIKFIKKLNELNQGQNVTQDDFDAGNVAFMPLSFAEYRAYKTYPYKIKKYTKFQWDCITMPAGPNGDNLSKVSALLMGISHSTRKEQLSWELLKLFTNDSRMQMKIYQYSQGASALKAVTDSKEAQYILKRDMDEDERVIDNEVLSTVIAQGIVVPKFTKYEEAMVLADSQVKSIMDDEGNLESSLKIFQRKLDAFLNQ